MSILDYFVPVKDDPDRLCCTLCHENLKIDSWYSNLKKHFKRVHNQEFAEFELMVKAEKEKAAAVEKAEGDDILLKSQAEFSKFNEDVEMQSHPFCDNMLVVIYGKCCEFLVIRVCGPAMPGGDTLVKRESRCQESQCKVSTTKTRTRRSNAKDGGAMLHGRTSDVIAHPVVWRVPRGPLQRHTLSRRTPGARPCAEHKTEADIIVRTCHTYSSFWHSGWQSVVGTW